MKVIVVISDDFDGFKVISIAQSPSATKDNFSISYN